MRSAKVVRVGPFGTVGSYLVAYSLPVHRMPHSEVSMGIHVVRFNPNTPETMSDQVQETLLSKVGRKGLRTSIALSKVPGVGELWFASHGVAVVASYDQRIAISWLLARLADLEDETTGIVLDLRLTLLDIAPKLYTPHKVT